MIGGADALWEKVDARLVAQGVPEGEWGEYRSGSSGAALRHGLAEVR